MGFLKGSQEAIDHMAKIRAMKGNNRVNTTEKKTKIDVCKMCGKKQN
jgi:hypothetical protein